MGVNPNILDVAKVAGVSAATVSHVINGTKQVSEKTKGTVLKAIRDLGYKPNMAARTFKTGKTKLIAFVVPDIANSFFATLIEEIENVLAEKGFKLMILNTKETKKREIDNINAVSSGMVDGFLIASTMEDYSELEGVLPENIPAVFIDRKLPHCTRDTITVNCYEAVETGIKFLIEKGHKKIGYITGLSRISTTTERLLAYENVMKANGLYDESLVKVGDSMSHCVDSHLTSLLENGCTAICIANNVMATEAMMLMSKKGILPGRDVELLGFKDSDLAQYGLQHMSLVRQPTKELGKLAGHQILDLIETPGKMASSILLNATFQPRN